MKNYSVLFVNNVPEVCGGTGAASLSMMAALPDCNHDILTMSGSWTKENKAPFPNGTKFHEGRSVRDVLLDKPFDLVVFQNTRDSQIPNHLPNNPRTAYYLHSNHHTAKRCVDRVDRVFVVSKYLARAAGFDEKYVLYQPVSIPPKGGWERDPSKLVLGRICTPVPQKWMIDDVTTPIRQVIESYHGKKDLGFEFVGCPDHLQPAIRTSITECAKGWNGSTPGCDFHPASFEARSLLHKWDVLLYKTPIQESYGRTVKEAQRCGCYPVVSAVGGFVEQVVGSAGWLCHADADFEKWAYRWSNDVEFRPRAMQELAGDAAGLSQWRARFLEAIA